MWGSGVSTAVPARQAGTLWRQANGGLGGSEDAGPSVFYGGVGRGKGPAPIPGCKLEPDPRQGAPFDSFILTAAPGGC